MADRKDRTPPRGVIASHFDTMTLAIFVILLGVAACSALEVGPVEALDRIGCGLNDAVNGLLDYPRTCHWSRSRPGGAT